MFLTPFLHNAKTKNAEDSIGGINNVSLQMYDIEVVAPNFGFKKEQIKDFTKTR